MTLHAAPADIDAARPDRPFSGLARSLASVIEVVDLTGDAVAAVGLLGAGRLGRSLGLVDAPGREHPPTPGALRAVGTFDPGLRRADRPR